MPGPRWARRHPGDHHVGGHQGGSPFPVLQVAVQGRAADAHILGDSGFLLPGSDAAPRLRDVLVGQDFRPAGVLTGFLGQRDALGLTLADDGTLKLGKGAEDAEHQISGRAGLAAEEPLLHASETIHSNWI